MNSYSVPERSWSAILQKEQEQDLARTAYMGECYSSKDARSDQCQHTDGEVRSVLRSTVTDECIAMLHPVGTIIRFRDEAEVYRPGAPYLT